MNEGKVISLLQSEEFLAKLNDASTVAETKKLFEAEGINLSDKKADIIMEALKSANQKAHGVEMMSEEDLELVSGGRFIGKSLEFVILSALICEGTYIGVEVYKRGGVKNERVLRLSRIGENLREKVENKIVNWLTTP